MMHKCPYCQKKVKTRRFYGIYAQYENICETCFTKIEKIK